jgi:uncharacterized membrane protein HdeD (DUF308 family)
MGISGVLSILFGVILFIRPGIGVLSVVWLIGIYAIFFGILLIILGFRLQGLKKRPQAEILEF